MKTSVVGLWAVAALVSATFIANPVSAAQARCSGDSCNRPLAGTKVNTTYHYKTVQRVNNVNRYRDVTRTSYRDITKTRYRDVNRIRYKDVNRTRYVRHINRIVTVTRVQPITRVHMVTRVHPRVVARVHERVIPRVHVTVIPRVHTRTVMLRQNQYASETRMLPTRTVMAGSRTVMAGSRQVARANGRASRAMASARPASSGRHPASTVGRGQSRGQSPTQNQSSD